MSEEFIGLLVFIAVGGFVAISIAALIFSWAFKVNQQIFYLRQIYDQLVRLNNANAAARTKEAHNSQ